MTCPTCGSDQIICDCKYEAIKKGAPIPRPEPQSAFEPPNPYDRGGRKSRRLVHDDWEKVAFINSGLGNDDNVSCDLDRMQYDAVNNKIIFLEFEKESQGDPWTGGSIFNKWTDSNGKERGPTFPQRTYAYMIKWHIVTKTAGALFMVIYPSEYQRSSGQTHILLIEILEMNFDKILHGNFWKLTLGTFWAWVRKLNKRCEVKRSDYYDNSIGITTDSHESQRPVTRGNAPYCGSPNSPTVVDRRPTPTQQ